MVQANQWKYAFIIIIANVFLVTVKVVLFKSCYFVTYKIDYSCLVDQVLGCVRLTLFQNRNTYNDEKKSRLRGFWSY